MKLICGRDSLNTEILSTEGLWYIISSDWLSEWKAFIFNKPYKSSIVHISANKKVGVLPPGPISNHTLFHKGHKTQILRQNLKKVSLVLCDLSCYLEH
jgi:hypothetical protein